MTDEFEKAIQRILKESAANGGPTNEHILSALIATNDDLDAQHRETRRWHEEVTEIVAKHIEEANTRDRRIDLLEQRGASCATYVAEAVDKRAKEERQHHLDFHNKHVLELHPPRRNEDPDGSDFSDRRDNPAVIVSAIDRKVWVMWGVGLFVAATIASDLIGLVIKALASGGS